ncbi:MAG: GldM family protein [Chitinophagales bacterium]
MSIPKEPRQLMINMMYIVLVALLALNVSAEVLNAFQLVSNGMKTSNTALDNKNAATMRALDAAYKNDPKKVKAYLEDAQKVQASVDEFVSEISALKAQLVKETGGWVDGEVDGKLKNDKDYDTPTRILIDKKKGKELHDKILALKETVLNVPSLTEEERENLANQITLSVDYDKDAAKRLGKKSWQEYLFDHVPTVAVYTLLTKIQGDAKSSESMVLEKLLGKIGAEDYKFDALSAKVIAPSSYVLQGEEYQADIFVSAFSSTQDPEVFIGEFDPAKVTWEKGDPLPTKVPDNPLKPGFETVEVSGGIADFRVPASSVGVKKKEGVIRVKQPQGDGYDWFPFKLEYQVAPPSVVVSPTKMNVFYIGVDNPVDISVAGFPADRVRASLTEGGSITGSGGNYIAKVKKVGNTKVSVSVVLDDGSVKNMGAQEFRMKRVPDPIAVIGGMTGGNVKASTFKVQRGVIAELKNFDFDIRFHIVGFEMTYAAKRQDLVTADASGPSFTPKMLDFLNRAKPGDVFYFDDIKAKGPDGITRKLPGIVFKLI